MYYVAVPGTTNVNISLSNSFSGSSEAPSFVPALMGDSFSFGVSGLKTDEPIAPYAQAFGNPEASAYNLLMEQPASNQFSEEPFSLSVEIPSPAELTDFSSLNIPFEVGSFVELQPETLPGELLLDLSGVISTQAVDPAMLGGLEALAIPVVDDLSDSWLDSSGIEPFASTYSSQLVDESQGFFGNVDLATTISSIDPINFPELGAGIGDAYGLAQDPFAPVSFGAIDALVPLQLNPIENINVGGLNPLQINIGVIDTSFSSSGNSPLPGDAETIAYPINLDHTNHR